MFGGASAIGANNAGASPSGGHSNNPNNNANNNNNSQFQTTIATMRGYLNRGEYFPAVNYSESLITSTSFVRDANVIEKERIFCLRAEALLAVKQFAKAEKEARSAIAVSDSTSVQAQYLLGSSLLGQFKIQESVDAFDVADAMMLSPQPWKYVVLPDDEAKSNERSAQAAQQRSLSVLAQAGMPSPTRERGIHLVPRRYRDIGIDDPFLVPERERVGAAQQQQQAVSATRALTAPPPAAGGGGGGVQVRPNQQHQQQQQRTQQQQSHKPHEFSPPLLPPPTVTYEWNNSYQHWKADARMARRLDQAHSTRLLPRGGLLTGVRMLEQMAKQSATKFLVVTLRNDTDYELVYQFHTCGSEDSASYHKDPNSPPPASNTQFMFKFPHIIPPGNIGVAIISNDSWRAKMLTLSAAVCFAVRRTKAQIAAEEARLLLRRQQAAEASSTSLSPAGSTNNNNNPSSARSTASSVASVIPSPMLRFSFALSAVMNNITAGVTVTPVPHVPSSAASNASSSAGNSPSRAAAQQQQQQQGLNPALSSLPPTNDKREKTDPKTVPNYASFSFDRRAFAAFALNALPSGLYSRTATAGGFTGTQTDIATIPTAYLSVVQKPGGLKTANGMTSRMSPVLVGCIAQFLQSRPLRLAGMVSTTWRSVVSSFPPPRFDDYPYGATMPDYTLARDVRCSPFTVRNEILHDETMLPTSEQQDDNAQQQQQQSKSKAAASSPPTPTTYWTVKREDGSMFRTLVFRTRRGDAVLHVVGEHARGNDYQVRLSGGAQGRSLLCKVTSTQGMFASFRTANVVWASAFATPSEIDLATRVAAKIVHEQGGGFNTISVCPTALAPIVQPGGSSSNNSNPAREIKSGWELVVPHPLPRGPLSASIRDIATKTNVARIDMDNGIYCLKFVTATDALWCALLAAEYLVSW